MMNQSFYRTIRLKYRLLRGRVIFVLHRNKYFNFFLMPAFKAKLGIVAFLYKRKYWNRPIQKNKIVFSGNYFDYSCNPKYITEKLLEKYPGQFDIVWSFLKNHIPPENMPREVRCINENDKTAFEEYATAKVWLDNFKIMYQFRRGLRKRPDQYYIETWHGSLGIKKVECSLGFMTTNPSVMIQKKMNHEAVDYWISNSTFENQVYKEAFFNENKKILMLGHARNDILFNEREKQREKINKLYSLEGKKIVLYLPTRREPFNMENFDVNYEAMLKSLSDRFGGEWVAFLRLHPYFKHYTQSFGIDNPNIIDVTLYQDVQELLAAADVVLSDYSSCMFDFMLTRRPVFIYARDMESYKDFRGFYYRIQDTPFPIAENNEELCNNIMKFDEGKYLQDVEAFLEEKGCMEDGKAAERIADLIYDLCHDKLPES